MAFKDMCAAAKDASKKALSKGDAASHNVAARLHDKASRAAFSQGDAATGKKHAALAKEHRGEVDKLTESNSASTSSSASESQDNPLLTWANSK